MATQKEYALLFKLQASLGSNFSQTLSSATAATKALQSTMQSLNTTSSKIESFQNQTTALDNQKAKLTQLQTEYQRLQQEMEETGDENGSLQAQMERTERQIEQTTNRIENQESRLDSLGNELREAGVDTDNLVSENARLSASYDDLRQSQEKLASISQAQQKNNEAIAKTQSQLTTAVGVTAAAGATVAATMIAPTMAFNDEMAMVGTLLDGTVDEVSAKTSQLGKEAVALSSSMGIDTSDVTDGLYQVISAYGETSESMAQLEMASKAAVAGGATTTDAVNLLSAVTKGYGDTSAEAQQKAADLAFQTVKLGQTTFPELASAMGSVIPTAVAMGVSQEELFGSMATLTGVTGSASEVTTQLKGVLQGFLSPSADMTAQMEALGYASGDAMIEALGLQGSLETLKTAVDGDTLALGNLFGSSEAQTAIFAMVGEQAENLTEKTLAMSNATGAATEAFDLMNSTDMARWNQATQTFKNLGIVLGQSLMPAITPIIEKVNQLVAQFSAWASENPELVASIFKITAGLAALVIGGLAVQLAVQKIYAGFLMVKKGIELAKLGVNVFSSSFKLLTPNIAVITAIAGAIWYVCTHLEDVRAFIENAFGSEALAYFDGFVALVQWVGEAISESFHNVMLMCADIGERIREGLATGIEAVLSFGEGIGNFVSNSIELLMSLGEYLTIAFVTTWETGWLMITSSWEVIKTIFSAGVEAAIGFLSGILDFILNVFTSSWSTAWQMVQTLFGGVMDTIGIYVQTGIEVFNGLIQFITGVFTGNWQQAWEGIKSIFSGVFDGIKSICSSVMNTIISAINTVIGGLNGLSIPDWVPGVGGMSLNIPLIPMFAKGTNYTPDTFIAGEAGAELITGGAGRKVFTAAQTGEIFQNLNKAQEMAETIPNYGDNATTMVAIAPELISAMSAVQQSKRQSLGDLDNSPPPPPTLGGGHPEIRTDGGDSSPISIVINSSPTFHISGDGGEVDEAKIRAMFEQYKELIKAEVLEQLESIQGDRVRRAYD